MIVKVWHVYSSWAAWWVGVVLIGGSRNMLVQAILVCVHKFLSFCHIYDTENLDGWLSKPQSFCPFLTPSLLVSNIFCDWDVFLSQTTTMKLLVHSHVLCLFLTTHKHGTFSVSLNPGRHSILFDVIFSTSFLACPTWHWHLLLSFYPFFFSLYSFILSFHFLAFFFPFFFPLFFFWLSKDRFT